jgi:hypothetical protein
VKRDRTTAPAQVWLLLALLAVQWSCSNAPPAGVPVTAHEGATRTSAPASAAAPEEHTAARPIGLVVGSAPPELDTGQKPGSAVDSQVAVGTLAGAGKGALSCLNVSGGFGGGQGAGLAALVWLVLCEPVAIVVGGTIGGVSAYSNRVEPAVRMPDDLRTAVKRSAATAQNDLLKALEESAAANGISTVRVSSKAVASGGNVPTRQTMPIESPATTVLEVTVVRFVAVAPGSTLQGDGVAVEARVRVIALPSRKVLDTYSVSRFPTNTTVSKAVSTSVDIDLAAAYREIAEAAFEESILVYRGKRNTAPQAVPTGSLNQAADGHSSNAAPFPDYTLQPIYPPAENAVPPGNDQATTGGWARRRLPDLQPVFRWEPLPASFERDSEIQDVTYEFRLYRGASPTPYIRSGLSTPTYSLETPLSPCELYAWTVRARFTLDGRPRLTEWAGAYNGGAVSIDSFGAAPPDPATIDPAWYRRNSFASQMGRPLSTAYYPHFRTAAASPSESCPADSTARPGMTAQNSAKMAAPTLSVGVASRAEAAAAANIPQASADGQTAVALATPSAMSPSATNSTWPKVGDSWTYNVLNGGHTVDTLTVAVAGASATQITETLTEGKSGTFKAERVFGLNFDPLNGFQETELPGRFFLAEFSPYAAPGRSDIGREWNGIPASLTLTLAGKVRESWHLKMKIVGAERVRVPAGEFGTLKVEAVSDSHRWADLGDGFLRLTFWYAPDIKRTVKMVRRFEASKAICAYTDVYELARYNVN